MPNSTTHLKKRQYQPFIILTENKTGENNFQLFFYDTGITPMSTSDKKVPQKKNES
jgi:hypothetical protein